MIETFIIESLLLEVITSTTSIRCRNKIIIISIDFKNVRMFVIIDRVRFLSFHFKLLDEYKYRYS